MNASSFRRLYKTVIRRQGSGEGDAEGGSGAGKAPGEKVRQGRAG